MQEELGALFAARDGHFRYESGHHGARWLDLEGLFCQPQRIRPLANELAHRLRDAAAPTAVCGPLVEGAFLGLMVAEVLQLPFTYATPVAQPPRDGLYSVAYRIPAVLRPAVHGQAVAIVNDVINAGSAVGGAFADLTACGAHPVAVGALLVLGAWTARFTAAHQLQLVTLAALPHDVWTPATCPLCAAGLPLEDHGPDAPG
jgi:orotate phosphoribosyltransferase